MQPTGGIGAIFQVVCVLIAPALPTVLPPDG
jgi:hypothetical protein